MSKRKPIMNTPVPTDYDKLKNFVQFLRQHVRMMQAREKELLGKLETWEAEVAKAKIRVKVAYGERAAAKNERQITMAKNRRVTKLNDALCKFMHEHHPHQLQTILRDNWKNKGKQADGVFAEIDKKFPTPRVDW